MKIRPILLGSVITLVVILALIGSCVAGALAAPYVRQTISGLKSNTPISISSAGAPAAQPQSQPGIAPTTAPLLTPAPSPTPVPLPSDASPEEQTAAAVYRQVSSSVVFIRVVESATSTVPHPQVPGFPNLPNQTPNQPQVASGSGFVLDKDGHIVTNNHVVDGANRIDVTFIDGTTVSAKVVGTDPDSDLAVIQVNVKASLLQPVELGDSSQLVVGQQAFAIGNPFGYQWTLTSGVVSAVGRTIQSGAGQYSIPEVVQTDAAINPGNSGGPLLDRHGRVIGVNTQIVSENRSSSGVGFAVPVNIVKQVVPVLIKDGHYTYAWLGIQGTNLTSDLAQAMNLSPDQRGALVIDVIANSPSAKAGVQAGGRQVTIDGDQVNVGGDVIVAVDGHQITGMDGVIDYLMTSKRPGDKITLSVLRDGQQKDIQVTLGERPKSQP